MSFTVFADGCANLPKKLLEGISLLPCSYLVNDEPVTYTGDIDDFDGHAYYEGLKNGDKVKTSLLNTALFLEHFTPLAQKGMDIIYIAMSPESVEPTMLQLQLQTSLWRNILTALFISWIPTAAVLVTEYLHLKRQS